MSQLPEPAKSRRPTSAEIDHAAALLQALADRTRLGIVALLIDASELSVGEIAERLDRPVPGISQHLAKLRTARLVAARRVGTSIRYRLPGEHVSELVRNLLHHTEHELFDDPPHHRSPAPPGDAG